MFGDCETNGTNPMSDEVITAYFECHDGNGNITDKYNLKSRVNKWSDEAAVIHKISKSQMLLYPDKSEAWDSFLGWLPQDFTFVCFANPSITNHIFINYF